MKCQQPGSRVSCQARGRMTQQEDWSRCRHGPPLCLASGCMGRQRTWCSPSHPRDITERPHAPSGVAAFMSAHSKTPYITPSMDLPSGNGVVRGAQGAAAGMYLPIPRTPRAWVHEVVGAHHADPRRLQPHLVAVPDRSIVVAWQNQSYTNRGFIFTCSVDSRTWFAPSTFGAWAQSASQLMASLQAWHHY